MQFGQTYRKLLLPLTIALVWHSGDPKTVTSQETSQDICAKEKTAAVQLPKSTETIRVDFVCDKETNTLFTKCRLPEYSKSLDRYFFAVIDGPDGLPYKLTCRKNALPLIELVYAATVCSKDNPTSPISDWITFVCDSSKTVIKECIVDGVKPGVKVGAPGTVVVRKSGRRYTLTCSRDSEPAFWEYNIFTSVDDTCSRNSKSADIEVGAGAVEVTFKCSYDEKKKRYSISSCKPKGKIFPVSANDNESFNGPNGQKLNIRCLPDAKPIITLKD